jgi:phytoene/squalene synthetase
MKERFDRLSAECSKITTRRYSTSFSLGIYFLDRRLHDPIYSIYGFVRLADEIVDSFHDYNKPYLLEKFKVDCFEAIEHGISLNPVLNSFQRVVRQYDIDHRLIHLFLRSMEMDLEESHYTAKKYEEYVLGSAQVVGLMCLRVFAGGDEEIYKHLEIPAMKLGSAFQKVNFLRDTQADYCQLNRIYFPGVNLSSFTDAEKRQIEADIENEFAEALKGIRQLPASSRVGVYLAYTYYRKLFNKIRQSTAKEILSERFRISNGQKFLLMFDSLIRDKINVL